MSFLSAENIKTIAQLIREAGMKPTIPIRMIRVKPHEFNLLKRDREKNPVDNMINFSDIWSLYYLSL